MAAGVVMVLAAILLVVQLIIEALRPFAGKIWLALIGVSVLALVILLGVHFAGGG